MNDKLPARKSIRLQNYDYSQAGYYFVTMCSKDKQKLFGEIIEVASFGQLQIELTPLGLLIDDTIKIASRGNVKIDKYVIMPNHIHMIVALEQSADERGRSSLQQIIWNIKSYVTKQVGGSVWQSRFYEHVIRDKIEYQNIWKYIDENPANWTKDRYHI